MSKKSQIIKKKRGIIKHLPPLGEILRGTFVKQRLVCMRPKCKCHKAKKYRHGPYYRIAYTKDSKSYSVYVSMSKKKQLSKWVRNYNKLWKGIEDISALNIKLIKI